MYGVPCVFGELEDRDDVAVLQAGGGARLAKEARAGADSSVEKSPAITLIATSRSSTGSRPR